MSARRPLLAWLLATLVALPAAAQQPTPPKKKPIDRSYQEINRQRSNRGPGKVTVRETYLESYLALFPSRATAAGDHRFDDRLEDLAPARLLAWMRYNKQAMREADLQLKDPALSADDRLDYQILREQAAREVFELDVLKRHETDPLYWTSMLSEAAVFLLVRDDKPLPERLSALGERVAGMPALIVSAQAVLAHGDKTARAKERCVRAAGQVRALAAFYRGGFLETARVLPAGEARDKQQARLAQVGARAAAALDEFAVFIDGLAETAEGSFRWGVRYPQLFRLATGHPESPAQVLKRAEEALVAKRQEAAEHCRKLWPSALAGVEQPADEKALVRQCFARIGRDGATDIDAFVADYRTLFAEAKRFVESKRLMTLPPTLDVQVDRSPAYFAGAAVGGIYPPGPYGPDGASLLFVPTPPGDATPEQLAAFFRDFNHHFNVMITPHETVPGHAAQMTVAAHGPSKLRALFANGVYVEGWGSFSERIMLDAGWGDDLARAAHLKKQLENIARAIVDIRVHTRDMSRDEVLAFVRDEALQDEQFAANMWNRTLTTAPQITTYWLGYQQIWDLYQEVRAARGEDFAMREFTDGMMRLGPVAVGHYREVFFPKTAAAAPVPAATP